MAAINSTQTAVNAAVTGFGVFGLLPHQVEKISCWNGSFLQLELFALFGKRIRVREQTVGCYDSDGFVRESIVYEAKVVGLHLGSAADGIETSLLLRQDGFEPDYVSVSNLTVLEVIE